MYMKEREKELLLTAFNQYLYLIFIKTNEEKLTKFPSCNPEEVQILRDLQKLHRHLGKHSRTVHGRPQCPPQLPQADTRTARAAVSANTHLSQQKCAPQSTKKMNSPYFLLAVQTAPRLMTAGCSHIVSYLVRHKSNL